MPEEVEFKKKAVLSEDQQIFCEGIACTVKEMLKKDEYINAIAVRVKDEVLKELADVKEVAKIQKEHHSFQDMRKDIENEKQLNAPAKDEEEE